MLKQKLQLTPEVNTGLIIEIREADFEFGGVTQIKHENRNTTGDWEQFLPNTERQKGLFETFGCVSFSGLNGIECQLQWLINNNLLTPEAMKFLTDNGYLDENGRPNCSDRFTVVMSKTVPGRGNSFQNVWDSIRKDGIVPERAWPNNLQELGRDEYYADIPQAVKDLGKEFLKYFEAGYEKVNQKDIPQALKHAPIQIGTATCSPWAGGVVPMCLDTPNHATMIYKVGDGVYFDFDQYEPFLKRLAKNFRIPYAYKCILSPLQSIGVTGKVEEKRMIKTTPNTNFFQAIWNLIKKLL